jgi:hypothetical protein
MSSSSSSLLSEPELQPKTADGATKSPTAVKANASVRRIVQRPQGPRTFAGAMPANAALGFAESIASGAAVAGAVAAGGVASIPSIGRALRGWATGRGSIDR